MLINDQRIRDISLKIKQLVKDSPISELEHNLDALIQGMFTKMELVSREELDTQAAVLQRTRQQLEVLEEKVRLLEQSRVSDTEK